MKFKRIISIILVAAMLSVSVVTVFASNEIMLLAYKYTKKCKSDIEFDKSTKTASMHAITQGVPDCPRITGFVKLYHQGWFGIWHLDKTWEGTVWGNTFEVNYEFTYTSGRTYKVVIDMDVYSGTVNDSENATDVSTYKAP